ncbi:MAG: hypothetical protein VB100_06375 [Angelakisella sp.]|nr:hypothetical protein [Angelakisella sp.]
MNLEEAFDRFAETKEYEQAQHKFFTIMRIAFQSGWQVSGMDSFAIGPANSKNEAGQP